MLYQFVKVRETTLEKYVVGRINSAIATALKLLDP